MKYRTKVDIPGYSETIPKGSTLTENRLDARYVYTDGKFNTVFFHEDYVKTHPEFFEPIQEPRWTDEDMRDYALFDQSQGLQSTLISLEKFKKWKGLS